MFHIVYKTTNITNGKYYIGVHSTQNLDDGYLGSGHLLKKAIAKYGRDAFTRSVLFHAFSKQDAFKVEREIVTEEFTLSKETYNLAVGGSGHAGITKRSRVIDIYDLELNFVCSKNSYTSAAQFTGAKNPGNIRQACKYADTNQSSRSGNFYVCHHGATPCKIAPDLHKLKEMSQKASALNTGKSRPEHSELMKRLNATRRDQTIYKFRHTSGTTFTGTKHDLMSAFPDHNIIKTELGVMIKGRYKSHKGWSLDD